MVTPNEHGVYSDGLERLEHAGKHSKAAILLAHCGMPDENNEAFARQMEDGEQRTFCFGEYLLVRRIAYE